jgi:hypothetical protein
MPADITMPMTTAADAISRGSPVGTTGREQVERAGRDVVEVGEARRQVDVGQDHARHRSDAAEM